MTKNLDAEAPPEPHEQTQPKRGSSYACLPAHRPDISPSYRRISKSYNPNLRLTS
jgi:hypothetical protein